LYSWNADDYLSTATEPDGTRWTYSYDPFGRRTRKLSAKGGTAFLWDGDRLAQEIPVAPDGSPAPDGLTPVARLHYAVSDAIGTPQDLLGEDGSLAWAARHHLWGAANDQQAVDTDCPLRFPGQIADGETGLYYNRFRSYDPQTTQYLTPDPIGLAGGLRSWGYVENPATWIDPLGLAGCPKSNYFHGGRSDAFRQAKGMLVYRALNIHIVLKSVIWPIVMVIQL
jgi:RHS repeat-associated protein